MTMELNLSFLINSLMFGVGLAMDAFSVSVANGLAHPDMPGSRCLKIAGVFGFFQTVMPLLGWLCVRTVVETFRSIQPLIPWLALILLVFIGGKMILEGLRNKEENQKTALRGGALFMQGIATSIDALSVGFAIADTRFPLALAESLIIGAVTFGLCFLGIRLGRRIGSRFSGKATIFGGCILILVGIKIFLDGIL